MTYEGLGVYTSDEDEDDDDDDDVYKSKRHNQYKTHMLRTLLGQYSGYFDQDEEEEEEDSDDDDMYMEDLDPSEGDPEYGERPLLPHLRRHNAVPSDSFLSSSSSRGRRKGVGGIRSSYR